MKQGEFKNLEQNEKLNEIYRSVEHTRKYFKWTLIISIAVIVLPLIGLLFAAPLFLSVYNFDALGL